MISGRGWLAVSAVLLCGAGVVAQAQGGPGFGPGFGRGFGGPGHAVVTGQPYTATATSSSVEKLADGATITHSSTTTEARDSEGRTLRTMTPAATGSATPVGHTTVMDPVAHTMTSWGGDSKTAVVMTLPEFKGGRGQGPRPDGPGPGGPGGPGRGGRVRPTVVTETLAGKSIAGVYATGTKTTITVPAGAEGNDKPLVSTREVWTSPDLKIVLLETSSDPRDGVHTMEVTQLSRTEPAASVFQVPEGYTVKTETRHRGE